MACDGITAEEMVQEAARLGYSGRLYRLPLPMFPSLSSASSRGRARLPAVFVTLARGNAAAEGGGWSM